MPDPANVHIDAVLTNLAIHYLNPAFVAPEFLPIIPVVKESDKYYKFGKEELRDIDSLRAVGAEAKEVDWDVSSETYSAEEYALKKLVPDRIVQNSDKPIRPKKTTTNKLMKWIGIGYEKRAQTLIQSRTNITRGGTPSIKWDASSGVTIEKNVDTAKESIRTNSGATANRILLSVPVKNVVKIDGTVRDLIRYTMPAASKLLTDGELPPVLWNLKTVIAGSIENTANEGQSDAIGDIWNDAVLVAYVDPDPSLETLTLGYTMRVKVNGKLDVVVKKWRVDKRDGEMIQVAVIQDEKIVAEECGYILTDVLE